MIQKSARFNIMVWYLVILAVTLSVFSLLIYGNFKRTIYEDLDDLLTSRVQGIADSVTTYIKVKESLATNVSLDPLRLINNADFVNDAQDWVEFKGKEPELMDVAIQVLDHNGKMIIASKHAPRFAAMDQEDMDSILSGKESFDIVKGETVDGKNESFRLYSFPIEIKGKTVCVVQAMSHINLLVLALHNLSFVLCILLPFTVLLAGIPGIFLVKLALSPVDKIIHTLKKITAGNLKLRIHIPDTKDEIRRLADTVNGILDRLDRSLACQNAFVEEIATELRDPLAFLKKDMNEVMAKDMMDDKSRKVLADGLKKVENVSQALEALVILTNIEKGKAPLEIRKTDVTKIASDVAGDFAVKASAKDIEFVFYSDREIIIDCDQVQIKKLFQIILDNAVKYTDKNGKIVMTVKEQNGDVKISVSDTGIGMPEDEIPYIFDRFYQISSGKRNKSGFGVGLSVAKIIVEEHNGKIEVSSQWGRGSTFTIILPLVYKV